MQSPMMSPPPLPGYPGAGSPPPAAAPAAAPAPYAPPPYGAPAPQGYPGPAVAAPAPVPQAAPAGPAPQPGQPFPAYAQPQPQAPAPVPFAAPPQGYTQPQAYGQPPQGYAQPQAYGQPPQAYAPQAMPAGFDVAAAIAAASGNGDRMPQPAPGAAYEWEVLGSEITQGPRETGGKFTFKMYLKVVATHTNGNPNVDPVGKEVAYIEGLSYDSGQNRAKHAIVCAAGFPSSAVMSEAYRAAGHDPEAAIKAFVAACGNRDTSPLKGRRVAGAVTTETRTPKTGKNAGVPTQYLTIAWTPR